MSETSSNNLLVVGSVAIDWIITPHAERAQSVGGSATYFSMAGGGLAPIQLVGVVGEDFPRAAVDDLVARGVDVDGLETIEGGLTFRWKGRYHENMNDRDTLETHLNCFEHFSPKLPEKYQQTDHLFLANIQPSLQSAVLEQMGRRPRVVGLDTMNLWIDIANEDLLKVLKQVDILMINEEEARQLSGEDNLLDAAKSVRGLGPSTLVIKRGEYGAMLFGPNDDDIFSVPALPLAKVVDPTGAGDCFAGGFMGYIAKKGTGLTSENLRTAMLWGSVMASFCVEGFSYDQLRGIEESSVANRFERLVRMCEIPR
jgi:sugar/nucleoside kinase (ribokinase family)